MNDIQKTFRAGDRLGEGRLDVVHFMSSLAKRSRGILPVANEISPLRLAALGSGRDDGHGAHIGTHCGCKRAFRAVTNSSTAATKRSPSASPIMMFSATKPRRAIQMPASSMSKKNSSLASWLLAAVSAAGRLGRVAASAVLL